MIWGFTSSGKLTSVEHLAIHGDLTGKLITPTYNLDLASATRLKSFSYTGSEFVDHRIQVGWGGLTHLSLEYGAHQGTSHTLATFYSQLNSCQNLTTCSLGISLPFRRLLGNEDILLPCLETLRVRRLTPRADAGCVIDPLILPQLKTLQIDAAMLVGWNEQWHDRQFSGLLARSACILQELYIKDVHFPPQELFRCFDHAPHLTTLVFDPFP